MLLTVHDELVLEVPQDRLEQTLGMVREVMEGAVSLRASRSSSTSVTGATGARRTGCGGALKLRQTLGRRDR